jgi:3-phosphoshikimate 1-carboxyvinyltransferase
MFASIAVGEAYIENFLVSRDTLATLNCLKALGVEIEEKDSENIIHVRSMGLNSFVEPEDVLNAQNSATTMRLLSGILSGRQFLTVITGDKYLNRRPMRRIIEPLVLMGACIVSRKGGYPPLAVFGKRLKGIEYELKIPSAQVKSAIILAGLQAEGRTVVIEKIRSRDHTERMLSWMGASIVREEEAIIVEPSQIVSQKRVRVPGDPSSAAFFVVAGVLAREGEVRILNCCLNETRTGYIRVLQRAGAGIELIYREEQSGEPVGDIIVKPSPDIEGFVIEPEEVPSVIDEIPILAVAAAFAKGESRLCGLEELRFKESDRLNAVALNLQKMGAYVEVIGNDLLIKGGRELNGAELQSFGDHRIAMAFSIAALFAKGQTLIRDTGCVDVSYPQFFEDLMLLLV